MLQGELGLPCSGAKKWSLSFRMKRLPDHFRDCELFVGDTHCECLLFQLLTFSGAKHNHPGSECQCDVGKKRRVASDTVDEAEERGDNERDEPEVETLGNFVDGFGIG